MQVELKSRLIDTVSYDEDNQVLRLFLANGTLREFIGVPKPTVDLLASAKSPGEFYMTNIRGKFPAPH
ncbi:KTSC domain-containing protein [Rhizobium sp. NFR07]|uniref:KTSC domain-containing protein n=1 Tax=Rhizobium sp. NFR07 TaxID=1566262 RepID=UPI0008E82108|nr:KTSC domain-containing protein [Rhizobium sp. NFR07]SFB50985.1 KTSC domain-containing protein [Rhizobium sp. NFR07]